MNSHREKGFVLLDVLLALFLFTLGFVALYGLSESALGEAEQALNLTQAANCAQNVMESLTAEPWMDNINKGQLIPGGEVVGQEGLFHWRVYSDWDIPNELLRVRVEVSWLEQQRVQSYELESLYAIQ